MAKITAINSEFNGSIGSVTFTNGEAVTDDIAVIGYAQGAEGYTVEYESESARSTVIEIPKLKRTLPHVIEIPRLKQASSETAIVVIPDDLTPEAQAAIIEDAMKEVDGDLLDFDSVDLDNKVVEPAPEVVEPKKVVAAKKSAAKSKD